MISAQAAAASGARTGQAGAFGGFRTRWALLLSGAGGLATGAWMASLTGFQSATYPLVVAGITIPGYAALYSLAVNLAVATAVTVVLNAIGSVESADETIATDYA